MITMNEQCSLDKFRTPSVKLSLIRAPNSHPNLYGYPPVASLISAACINLYVNGVRNHFQDMCVINPSYCPLWTNWYTGLINRHFQSSTHLLLIPQKASEGRTVGYLCFPGIRHMSTKGHLSTLHWYKYLCAVQVALERAVMWVSKWVLRYLCWTL